MIDKIADAYVSIANDIVNKGIGIKWGQVYCLNGNVVDGMVSGGPWVDAKTYCTSWEIAGACQQRMTIQTLLDAANEMYPDEDSILNSLGMLLKKPERICAAFVGDWKKVHEKIPTFPIQGGWDRKAHKHLPGTRIPLWLAEIAHDKYKSLYSNGQTLEELASRGGFGREELVSLLQRD